MSEEELNREMNDLKEEINKINQQINVMNKEIKNKKFYEEKNEELKKEI